MRPAFLFLLLIPVAASAGTVYLQDESVLHGQIQGLDNGVLAVKTGFAGTIQITMDQVIGLQTEQPVVLVLENGDTVRAKLAYDREAGMRLRSPVLGETAIEPAQITAIRPPGAPTPAQEKLAALEQAQAHRWSGQIQLGLAGNSGNSDARSINIGAKATRESKDERLFLSLLVNKAQQDNEETPDETLATVRLERDLSDRFFVFAQTEGEHDEFENIDYRSTTTLGPGYFFVKGEHQELKGRLGLGYEFVAPVVGENISELVLTLGYDYFIDVADWFRFSHNLTLIPRVTDSPADNYRVDSVLGVEMPLGPKSSWSLLGQLRHEYNHSPEPGVEELDTTWLLNLVRDFE
ncbi:MAG: DUF481 domain-containing protein [Salinisphaera sp.]|nr:DUF481 domain-containing protein [Salinisphaera sp.]